MLCDQLIEYCADPKRLRVLPRIREEYTALFAVRDRVTKAHRYTLDRASTLLVHDVQTMRPSKMFDAFRICRLPHANMWIEFDFANRTEWLERVMRTEGFKPSTNPMSVTPIRLGLYVERLDAHGRRFTIHPVWSLRDPDPNTLEVSICNLVMLIDLDDLRLRPFSDEKVEQHVSAMKRREATWTTKYLRDRREVEALLSLENHIRPHIPDYLAPLWTVAAESPETEKVMYEAAQYDLASEWRFFLAFLMILNSRNLVQYGDEEDYTRLNRQRVKSGKSPLLAHRPITLSLHLRDYMRRVYSRSAADPTDIHRHIVGGHFKLRKSGLWWWSPHLRGNVGEVPETPRTYHVKP